MIDFAEIGRGIDALIGLALGPLAASVVSRQSRSSWLGVLLGVAAGVGAVVIVREVLR